ncbi:putative ribonuclease H-like domain-containing protein [Tanacetum coccineum]
MDDFYREKGIKGEYSVARTPQQNGVDERRNRTLIEATRTMLADSKLPTTFCNILLLVQFLMTLQCSQAVQTKNECQNLLSEQGFSWWKNFCNSNFNKFGYLWDLPNGSRPIGTKWVLHNKKDEREFDYAGATLDRKFTTEGCQFLGNRLISWQCKKQTVVATSTTEAEYVAAASCYGQVLWIQNQLRDYGIKTHLGISKEVGTPRYLSLVVPLTKVGDEAVHKELGDRMERAATTASSLEAEQDSGSGPRCQDTILGDVNAQTSPKFAETHNVVAFLEKPEESDGFAEIIDFLKASSVSYALTVNPVIYTSCIEQFWATAKVQTVNGVRQLQALVDKKRVIVTESSIRRDLHLDDVEGTDCLPTATIFEELARMGYEKPSQKLTFYKAFFSPQWKYFIHTITQCLSAKSTAWNEFSSSMASLIICLATNQKFNLSKLSGRITPLFDTMMVQPVEEMAKDAQAKEIVALKKRIQRLERRKMSRPTGLKRLSKVERQNDDLMFDSGVYTEQRDSQKAALRSSPRIPTTAFLELGCWDVG